MASWLVRSSPVQTVWVRVLAGDIALCSWAKTLYSHSASLHPGVQMSEFDAGRGGGNPAID